MEDQADPAPNNFRQTPMQGLAQCKGFRINHIRLTQVIPHFSHPDHKAYLRKLEWGIQVQRRHSLCWLSRTDRWKPSKGGMLKKENREREGA